jgi:hypothetical protein
MLIHLQILNQNMQIAIYQNLQPIHGLEAINKVIRSLGSSLRLGILYYQEMRKDKLNYLML